MDGRGLKNCAVLLGLAAIFSIVLITPSTIESLRARLPKPAPRKKALKGTLAEGLVINLSGYYGVDFVKCGKCRMEKRRVGPLTLGGQNVLVLEGLSVVIPPRTKGLDSCQASSSEDSGQTAKDILNEMGVGSSFWEQNGMPRRFSGLRIEGLDVARLDGGRVVPLFSAKSGEAANNGLRLTDCAIISNGESCVVHRAELRAKPCLRLEWRHGGMDL